LAKLLSVSQDLDAFDVRFLETGVVQQATPFDCLRVVGGSEVEEEEQRERSNLTLEDFNFVRESVFLHLPVREIRVSDKLFRRVFDGKHAVTFLLENGEDFFCNVRSRREACAIFQRMLDENSIVEVENNLAKLFVDSIVLYMICSSAPAPATSSSSFESRYVC
jgi:hypothetical protein